MSEKIKRINKKSMQRNIAWLLIVIMMITCVNPTMFALAGKSEDWNVDWMVELDGEIIETNENKVIFQVEEGQEVNFLFEMTEGTENNHDRFQQTFKISLPIYLYDLITEEGETPIDWEEMSGGILEEINVATASDAKSTASNATSTSSDAQIATDSNSTLTLHNIELQFNEDLRNEENPEDVMVDDIACNLKFEAPEDMILTGIQDHNDYKIIMTLTASASDAIIKPLIYTEHWDVTWKMTVNGAVCEAGKDIVVDIGDRVGFEFIVSPKSNQSIDYSDIFVLTMPKEMYDIMGDFTWQQVTGTNGQKHQLFTSTDDGGDPLTVITISFTDYFQNGAGKTLIPEKATSSFGFEANKKVTISYEQNKDDDTTEINYKEPVKSEAKTKINKFVNYIFNENVGKGRINIAIEGGDYVLFNIMVTLENAEEGEIYIIPENTIYDCFNTNVYEFVDLSNSGITDELLTLVSNISSENISDNDRGIIKNTLNSSVDVRTWNGPLQSIPDDPIPNKGEPGYVVYGNGVAHELSSEQKTLSLCMCLKVKDGIDFTAYEENDLVNHAYLDNENGSNSAGVGPSKFGYYDQALEIYPTSIWHENATGSTSIGNVYNFPKILDNEKAAVNPGDYVTFRTTTYEQGTWKSKIKSIEIYVPIGFEPITNLGELPNGFTYVTDSSKVEVPSNDNYRFLENFSGDFKLEDYHQGEDLDYEKLIQVKRYTYTFDIPVAKAELYVTCQVKDLDTILNEAGMSNTPENRILAERYGYLISAEISEIVDLTTLNKVEDEDSWIDNLPFNDWYNNQKDPRKDLKLKNLYYYLPGGWAVGEMDYTSGLHVRSLTKRWDPNGAHDEDDFDYAIVYLYKPDELTDSKGIFKEVKDHDSQSKAVADLLNLMDTKFSLEGENAYSNRYHTLQGGELSGTQTIIPYRVYINRDGSKTMSKVIFTDELPETMSFLLRPDGKPVVSISERIEENGHRYPMIDKDGNEIEIIKEEDSKDWKVKNPLDDDFYKSKKECYKPSGISDDNKWNFSVQDKTLTINFGDIDNNAYFIDYYAVVEKISNSYRNSASVEWDENPKETVGVEFSKWAANTGRFYSKTVMNNEGEFVTESQLEDIDQTAGLDLTYRLFITIDGTQPYESRELIYYDYLDDLFDGERPDNIEVRNITYKDLDENEIDFPSFEATFNEDKLELVITNSKELKDEASYIEFTVHYNEIPYGTTIKNTFGRAVTKVKTPLKLDLEKVNGDTGTLLSGAEFKVSYDADGDNIVNDVTDTPIHITTTSGMASTKFFLDDAYKNVDGAFFLYLIEEKVPSGYYDLGGINGLPDTPYVIELKVTVDNGIYKITALNTNNEDNVYYQLTGGELNEIQITVKNYRPKVALEAQKDHIGHDLVGNEFTFILELYLSEPDKHIYHESTELINNVPMITVTNKADGIINFPELTTSSGAGSFVFKIYEEKGSNLNIAYDEHEFYAVLTFDDAGNTTTDYYISYSNISDPSGEGNILIEGEVPVFINRDTIPLLPETGGPGTIWSTLSGLLLMCFSLSVFIKKKRRRRII